MATTSEIQGRNLKFYISKTAQQAAALAATEPEAVCFTEAGIIMNGQVYAEPNAAQTNYAVTVTKTTPSGMAARYTISQAATGLSAQIDIPKDMVVQSGAVQTVAANSVSDGNGGYLAAGTYLVLTLANATSDKVYINVGSLIEYVTSGSGTNDAIQIAVNASTHKVTASVKSGSITNDMLAGSIAYSKLAGSIPKSKLDSGVQTSLGKADTALQSHQTVVLESGTNNGTLKITVNGTATDNVAVKGLASAAYKTAGAASGNVPLIGAALSNQEDHVVLIDANGKLKPGGTLPSGEAGSHDLGYDVGQIPYWALKWGADDSASLTLPFKRPVVLSVVGVEGHEIAGLITLPASKLEQSSTNGKVKYTNEVGEEFDVAVKGLASAAYKTAGAASGNVPVNGAALGSTDNVPVVTNTSGQLKPHSSGALKTGAFTAAGSAANNVPLVGTAISGKENYPLLADANGKIKPGTAALGGAAYKAENYYATFSAFSEASSALADVIEEVDALLTALTWQ
ncbi:MAG: hypothetical protein IJT97_11270 [Bacteroidaceae bacterium]|nr:hypothetical protein [Bacteroidaceae bacterium]